MAKRPTENAIRLVRHGVSVYEVEVDLGRYAGVTTNQLNGFAARLVRLFPGLRKHECYAGEAGGFIMEMKCGTDLAHVMEHLTLEMLKVACGRRRRFTGWTRKKGKTYVIHFQAPDGSMGRCAATSALEVIEKVLCGKSVDKQGLLRGIRASREVRR
jgi:cyanophycin synthetase